MNSDDSKFEDLKDEYNNFIVGIDEATSEGKISVYYRRVIIDMSKKVLEGIARKHEKIEKGVNEIMGGRVLEHEGKTILNQGIARGRAQGMAQGITQGMAIGEQHGRQEANLEFAKRLRDRGMNQEEVHQLTDLSMDKIKLLYK